ncbi:MAG: substrate-binding domain-containing protein, partial [Prochloraceae cyanobacterium]
WEQPWDILFFAGHSRSEGQRGRIYINQNDSLSIEEISSALKKVIEGGLQLAIFNSCDGLGLANELEKLHIPQTIVMREAVPDRVAQKFLTYFLPSFAQGATLYQAVRWARERLKGLESEIPGASWLPVICQNPAVVPPTWSDLLGKKLSPLSSPLPENESAQRETQELKLASNNGLQQTRAIESISIAQSPLAEAKEPSPRSILKVNQEKKKKNHQLGLVFLSVLGIVSSALAALLLLQVVRLMTTSAASSPPERTSSNSTLNNPSKLTSQNAPIASNNSSLSQVDGVPSGTFRYGGSTAWSLLRSQVHPAIESVWPKFNLLESEHPTIAPSSGIGVQMLLHDHLHIAHTSRPLQPEEYQQAQEYGLKIKQIPVAIDGIVFAVNPNLNLTGLTLAQLRDIYTGKITNWKQVGGPNLTIFPYSKSPQVSGTAEFFVSRILIEEQLSAGVKLVTNMSDTLRQVATQKGSIVYASASEIIPQCSVKPLALGRTPSELIPPYQEPLMPPEKCPASPNQLNIQAFQQARYPLIHNLYVIVKQNERIDEQAGVAYAQLLLTKEGQKLIEKAGFVPIH